jgi:hypothetical protein
MRDCGSPFASPFQGFNPLPPLGRFPDTTRSAGGAFIRQVLEKNGRWRVVASIRKFDLRYGVEIKALFGGFLATEFGDPAR